MSPRTTSGPRRYKLRVNFVGLDAYDRDENVLPYRKLIYIAYENESIRNVCEGINTLFAKLYPEDGHNKVVRLRDSFMCDVSDDFIVSEVFDESPEVYAAMKELSVSDDLPESALLSTSNDHQRIAVRPKRKRYILTPCRDMVPLLIDRRESMPLEVAARNGCSPDGIVRSTDRPKRIRLDSSSSKMTNQRRYGTESPELGSFGDKHEFTNVLVSAATSAAALGITSRTNVIKNSLPGTGRPGILINRDSHVFSAIAPSYISGVGLDIVGGTPHSEAMSPELGQHIYQLQNPHPEAELNPSVNEEPSSEQADGVDSRNDNEPPAHNAAVTSPPTTRSSARLAKNQTKDLVSTTPAASKLTEKAAVKPKPELEADADSDSAQMDAESVAPTSTANTEIAAAATAASATPSSDVTGEGEKSGEAESSDGSAMEVDDDNVKVKVDAEADESSDEDSGSDDEEESSDDEAAEEDVKTEPGVEAEGSSEEEEEDEE
ncbi:hypothetical protein GGF37_001060 [Kickxella alabastrina]|nr:hypothetical protein GGF37_001060 [Kickxella alabastrina]